MKRDVPLINEEFWETILDREDLTGLEWATLVFIAEYTRKNLCPPHLRDICAHFGYSSSNAPNHALNGLKAKGRIDRHQRSRSGVFLLGVEWVPRRARKEEDSEPVNAVS